MTVCEQDYSKSSQNSRKFHRAEQERIRHTKINGTFKGEVVSNRLTESNNGTTVKLSVSAATVSRVLSNGNNDGPALERFQKDCGHPICQLGGNRVVRLALAVANSVHKKQRVENNQVKDALSSALPDDTKFDSGVKIKCTSHAASHELQRNRFT